MTNCVEILRHFSDELLRILIIVLSIPRLFFFCHRKSFCGMTCQNGCIRKRITRIRFGSDEFFPSSCLKIFVDPFYSCFSSHSFFLTNFFVRCPFLHFFPLDPSRRILKKYHKSYLKSRPPSNPMKKILSISSVSEIIFEICFNNEICLIFSHFSF